MSPAGTAVGGDVLVAHVGDHVLCIDVVPEPLLGEVVDGLKRGVDLGSSPVRVSYTARLTRVNSAELGKGSDAQKSGNSESFHE